MKYVVTAGGKFFHFCDGHWDWFDEPQSSTDKIDEAIRQLNYALGELGRTPSNPHIATYRIVTEPVPDILLTEARDEVAREILRARLTSSEAQLLIDYITKMNTPSAE